MPSYGNFFTIQKEKTREQNEGKVYMLQILYIIMLAMALLQPVRYKEKH